MSLLLGNYFQEKTIKLSDSFAVYIQENPTDNLILYPDATSFTIQSPTFSEETIFYGNTSQTFLKPNYESMKELKIEFYESIEFDSSSQQYVNKIESFIERNSQYKLSQKFDGNTYSENIGKYVLEKEITINENKESNKTSETKTEGASASAKAPAEKNISDKSTKVKIRNCINSIEIRILSNNLQYYVYQYKFKNLKIINYDLYSFNYMDETPAKITITFSFEDYEKKALPLVKVPFDTPNGDITAPEIDLSKLKPDIYVETDKTKKDKKDVASAAGEKPKDQWRDAGQAFTPVKMGSLKQGQTQYYQQGENGDVLKISRSNNGKTITIEGTTTNKDGQISTFTKTIERGKMSETDFKNEARAAISEIYGSDADMDVQFTALQPSGKKKNQVTAETKFNNRFEELSKQARSQPPALMDEPALSLKETNYDLQELRTQNIARVAKNQLKQNILKDDLNTMFNDEFEYELPDLEDEDNYKASLAELHHVGDQLLEEHGFKSADKPSEPPAEKNKST